MLDSAREKKGAFVATITGRVGITVSMFIHHPAVPVALIFFCLGAGIVLKIVFITISYGSDDINYLKFSEQILNTFSLDTYHHHAGRLALLVMTGFPAVLMGDLYFAGLANVIYILITEILVIAFLYVRLGPAPAAAAAAFLTFSGVNLTSSGGFVPEPLSAMFFICVCIALYQAVAPSVDNHRKWAMLAGIAAGFAYSAKTTGILILPPALLSLMLLPWPLVNVRNRIYLACTFLAGFTGIWLLESTAYWALSGDFLYKSHAIAAVHNLNVAAQPNFLTFFKTGLGHFLGVVGNLEFFLIPVALASVAWVVMLYSRTPWAIFALVGAFTGGYLFFGTSSLSRLVNLPAQARYTLMLFPLIAVGVGYLYWKWKHVVVRTAIALLILVSGIVSVQGASHQVGQRYFESLLRNTVIAIEVLPQIGQKQIYLQDRYRSALRHYLSEATWQTLRDIPLQGPLPDGYYMLIQEHLSQRYKDKSENAVRLDEIARLPVVLRVALPHTFASRYFADADIPKRSAIVHEK